MKQITQQQIEAILKLAYDLNCPAKAWEELKKMLAELTEIQSAATQKPEKVKKA